MATPFPAIRPTSRLYVPGSLPQTVSRTMNGRTVRRPFASTPGGPLLELSYENITDDQVEAFRQAWRAARGHYDSLTLPPEVWSGDDPLGVFAGLLPEGSAWRFTGEVEVERVKRGRATVRVRLRNYTRSVLTLPLPPDTGVPPIVELTVCSRLSAIDPSPTAQPATGVAYSSDGKRIYMGIKVPAVAASTWYAALAAFDAATGSLLWAVEDTSRNIHPGNLVTGVVTLPDESVVMCIDSPSFRTHKMYRFSSAGALLAARTWEGQIVPGNSVASTRMIYVASLNKLALSWNGPGVYLYDPLTLATLQRVQSTRIVIGNHLLYIPSTQRFLAMGRDGGDHALFEFSSDLSLVPQKYQYITSGKPIQLQFEAWAADSFGAVYGCAFKAGNGASEGIFILRLAASAGAFIPLSITQLTHQNDTVAGGFINAVSRIDVKPDGTILVLLGSYVGTNTYRYVVWELNAEATASTARTVVTLSTVTSAYETENAQGTDHSYTPDWTTLVLSHDRMSPIQIPINLPLYNELSYPSTAGYGTVRVYREPWNRTLVNRADLLPARNINPYGTIVPTNTEVSQPPTMADLTARFTWNAYGQCKTFKEVWGFGVSETTTAGAQMVIGAANWYWHTALTTAAGNIYWAGLATVSGQTYSQARWFVMKYDKDLNQLWAKWLEGPYVTGTLPPQSQSNGPALAEGPNDGVFVVTKGKDETSSPRTTGASFRIYLFNAEGALLNVAAWSVAPNQFGGAIIQQDIPAAALYVPSQDKLYIAGQNHLRVVMRGLTLDQPYGVDGGAYSQGGNKRIFWLPDKNRVLYVGRADDGVTTGDFVAEYSPDLQTRFQSYSYNMPNGTHSGSAMDAFGAVYFVNSLDGTSSSPKIQLTKLAASDAGYIPLWSRTFVITPVPSGFITLSDASIEIMPDGRIVIAATQGNGQTGMRDMRVQLHVLSPDGTKIISRTRLLWSGTQGNTAYPNFVDFTRETATFITGSFTLGQTSLKLPPIGVDIPLGSTATGTNANKNMTGNTDYTEVLLTDVALPSRTVISALSRNPNPMVKWGEDAWTTSDLTATVQHTRVASGPLQAPQ